MLLWLLLTWVVVALLIGPDLWRAHAKRAGKQHERGSATPVQILFAEHQGETISVDCVLLEPLNVENRTLPSGFPVSLHFEPLTDRALATAACNIIGRWADEDRTITLRLITENGLSRARLTDDHTTLHLDLEGAYG